MIETLGNWWIQNIVLNELLAGWGLIISIAVMLGYLIWAIIGYIVYKVTSR
jgi:hypothetical protein